MSAVILNIPSSVTPAGLSNERSAIAYNNLLSPSDITVSTNTGDKGYLVDGMTTTSWPSGSSSSTIIPNVNGQSVNCIAFSPSNFGGASAAIKIDVTTASGAETVFNGSGFKDNDPLMFVFNERVVTGITITLTTTGVLYLTGLFVGVAMIFPCGVSAGYQPGRWSTDDEINTFRTESNAFGHSTVYSRGTTESFSIENINQEFMNSEWTDFINNAKGKQIWFSWDYNESPRDVMYGSWTANKPNYDTSVHSSVNLTIQGLSS